MSNPSSSSVDPSSAPYGVFVLRAALGVMWIAHALMKYVLFTIPGFAGFLAKVGFPAELAWPVFLAELAGGILILTGVYARHVALLLIPVMAAASSVHLANGWVFSNAGGGWEYPAFLIVASFALWLLGDGAFALRSRPLWFIGESRRAVTA
jgi:putative oxidoreductase